VQIVVVYMVVYLVLLLSELLGKFLQHRLLALLKVSALDVGLGFASVHFDLLLNPLDLQSQCFQGCWDLLHQVSLDCLHLLWFLI
jgi:hypothetical protein